MKSTMMGEIVKSDVYRQGDDIKHLKNHYSLMSKDFSIELIKMKYRRMSPDTKLVADRTLVALETGKFWDTIDG